MSITLRSLLVNQSFALLDAPEHFAYNLIAGIVERPLNFEFSDKQSCFGVAFLSMH